METDTPMLPRNAAGKISKISNVWIMSLRIIHEGQNAAKIAVPNTQSNNFVSSLFMLALSGCREGVFVAPGESVSCATGAGTTVSSVTVTTAPPSCVVKTCSEVID